MPGGEVLALPEALQVTRLEFTLVKHGNAGRHVAEGSWHATGVPSVLIASLGLGIANALNTLANAYQEPVPFNVLVDNLLALIEKSKLRCG